MVNLELKEKIFQEGIYVVGIVSDPGKLDVKEGFEPRFKLRVASGGDQLHSPVFMSITFYGENAEPASKLKYLYERYSKVALHGRLSTNISKDGKRVFTEIAADSIIQL